MLIKHHPTKGHITLKPFLSQDKKLAKEYINNYTCHFTGKIFPTTAFNALFPENQINLRNNYTRLMTIKNSLTNMNIRESILECNEIILKISLNPIYANLDVNFTLATDIDIVDEEFQTLLALISTNIASNVDILDLETFFPKNNQIPLDKYKDKVRVIIDKLVPEPLREQVLINYNKYIEDSHDR